MFVVSEDVVAAVRQAWERGGELAAAVELRRHFPGIADNAAARRCVQAMLQWKPLPPLPAKKRQRRARPPA